jgi:transposase-like protein
MTDQSLMVQLPEVSPLIPDELLYDDELIAAVQYLALKREKIANRDIAAAFSIAEVTLYTWLRRWKENGVLDRARRYALARDLEEIENVKMQIARAWPEVVDRVLRIAIYSRSDKTALEAAAFIKANYIDPISDENRHSSSESDWATRPGDFLPNVVEMPSFLKTTKQKAIEAEQTRKGTSGRSAK